MFILKELQNFNIQFLENSIFQLLFQENVIMKEI